MRFLIKSVGQCRVIGVVMLKQSRCCCIRECERAPLHACVRMRVVARGLLKRHETACGLAIAMVQYSVDNSV